MATTASYSIVAEKSTFIEMLLKYVARLFTHLKINSVKLHLELHKSLSMLFVLSCIGLMLVAVDSAETVILTV